jgi:hypothetical protein
MERASVINQFREELEIKDDGDDEQEGDHDDEENPDLAPKRQGASLYSCREWTSALGEKEKPLPRRPMRSARSMTLTRPRPVPEQLIASHDLTALRRRLPRLL